MKLKRKYDWLMILMYSIAFAICAFMIIYPFTTLDKNKMGFIDIIFTTASFIVISYLLMNLFSIKYRIDDKHLYVKNGFHNYELELKKIIEIKHVRKFFSTYITSTHCLEIIYSPFGTNADLRYVYLSVKDENELIEKIKEKAKRLKIDEPKK